eukprot:9817527-Alexandrium_andersonii.AAC.1
MPRLRFAGAGCDAGAMQKGAGGASAEPWGAGSQGKGKHEEAPGAEHPRRSQGRWSACLLYTSPSPRD